MSGFEPRLDVLPSAQRAIWPRLAPTVELGLVLYGGTAVALRLGHRTSVDFDFFSEKPLQLEKLDNSFAFLKTAKVIQSQPNTLSVLVPGPEVGGKANDAANVRISFFGDLGIGRAGVPDRTPDGVLEVASLLDLLATKLKVILQRIEAKDYRDIVAILGAGLRLEEGLAAAAQLYPPNFQPSEAIKALTYFEGGDLAQLTGAERLVLTRSVADLRRIPLLALASQSLSLRS